MTRLLIIACLAVVFLAVTPKSQAQPKKKPKAEPTPGDVMIEKYLAAETDKLSKKFMDGAKTLKEWQDKRPRLYREYMDMLGLWPIPEKTPLDVTFTGIVELGDVIVDKLHYQSKPGLYVTANLYRPIDSIERARNGKRYPAVVYVCGHSNRGRDGNKTAFQDHGLWFARNGYVCIVLDTLQLGEIPAVHHGTYGVPWISLKAYETDGVKRPRPNDHPRWWWHSAGYTPAGVECWNGVRAIDYLVSRPDVDAKKIAVTGISGGGAATFWIAAADDRVACAVPVSGMSDLESYVKNKVVNGHCDCMFLYNTYQWDWTTIAALVAPRPMLFANSDNDPIFPMDGNRRIIAKLRKLYAMYDKPELVDDYVSVGGHDYRPDLRIAIFKWINKHVKNGTGPVKDAGPLVEIPGRALRVFREESDIPKDAINAKVDETFVARAQVAPPTSTEYALWKREMSQQVRSRVFRSILDLKAIKVEGGLPFSMNVFRMLYSEPPLHAWQASMIVGNDPDKTRPAESVLIVMDKTIDRFAEAGYPRAPKWAIPHCQVSHADVVFPRGIASVSEWSHKSPPNYVKRSHLLIGRTIDDGRVWDIVASIRQREQERKALKDNGNLKVVGRGQAGILAAYAALFEPSIKEVVIIDPPKSHMEGPHFLGVLRVLDIPEALGLLAPNVKLTLINARDPAFDRTEAIYRAAGAAGKLIRK